MGRSFATRSTNGAAALILGAIVIVAVGCSSSPGPATAQKPTAASTVSSGPTGAVVLVPDLRQGPLTPGKYRIRPLQGISSLSIDLNVPQGWDGFPDWAVLGPKGTGAPGGIGVGFLSAEGLFSDPCHWDAKGDGSWPQVGDVTVGPTAADLATALLASHAYTATALADVAVDGYPAKRIDLQLPSNVGACDKGKGQTAGAYFVWGTKHTGGSDLYAQGPGTRWRLWIVDAEGARLVIVIDDYAATPAADRAAAQSIVDSVTIAP